MTKAGKQGSPLYAGADLPGVDEPEHRWYRRPGETQPVYEFVGVKRAIELEAKGWEEIRERRGEPAPDDPNFVRTIEGRSPMFQGTSEEARERFLEKQAPVEPSEATGVLPFEVDPENELRVTRIGSATVDFEAVNMEGRNRYLYKHGAWPTNPGEPVEQASDEVEAGTDETETTSSLSGSEFDRVFGDAEGAAPTA